MVEIGAWHGLMTDSGNVDDTQTDNEPFIFKFYHHFLQIDSHKIANFHDPNSEERTSSKHVGITITIKLYKSLELLQSQETIR